MLIAEKIMCELTNKEELTGECILPPASALDWASALSGVVSVALAVAFGVWSIRHANKERKRAEDAERRVRLGQVCDRIIDAFSKISETEKVRNADIPWLSTHFQALSGALSPFGKTAEDFYEEASTFALEIILYVQHLFNYEAVSENELPDEISLGVMQGLIIREAVGTLRSGLNSFSFAENETMRTEALTRFRESVQRTTPLR